MSDQDASPNFFQFYFSMKGRISRRQYWLFYVVPSAICFVATVFGFYEFFKLTKGEPSPNPNLETAIIVGILLTYIGLQMFVSYVMHVKRCHDLGLSVFAGYATDKHGNNYDISKPLSIIGGPIIFWRMLFEEGSSSHNQFGPSPSKSET